jgi:hypothetical protein
VDNRTAVKNSNVVLSSVHHPRNVIELQRITVNQSRPQEPLLTVRVDKGGKAQYAVDTRR